LAAGGPTIELLQEDKLLHQTSLEKPLRMQKCPIGDLLKKT